jgi:integrase
MVAVIHVTDGTKGKRPRVVQIVDDWGLRTAKMLIDEMEFLGYGYTYLPPPDKTLEQNAETYMRVLKKFGLTKKKLGVTGHGLRAGFACDLLESYGITPTVRGGDGQHADPEMQQAVYKVVTEAMGHGRTGVVGAYAGAITPRGAARQKKAMEAKAARMAELARLDQMTTEEILQDEGKS